MMAVTSEPVLRNAGVTREVAHGLLTAAAGAPIAVSVLVAEARELGVSVNYLVEEINSVACAMA